MTGLESTVVVLFADVSGSARLYERLGEAEAVRAVDRCIKRMERSVDSFRGRLVKADTNEMLATFPSAEEACQAAREMQQRVASLPPVSGVQLTVRIGLHTGPVPTGSGIESSDTVKNTARVIGLASAGQILASAPVVAELPDNIAAFVRDSSIQEKVGGQPVKELLWSDEAIAEPASPAVAPAQPEPVAAAPAEAVSYVDDSDDKTRPVQLCIRYRGKAYLLDHRTPLMALGRDSSCDLVIKDQKASRQHARIEKRGVQYFYVDRSSNGTYVAFGKGPETLIKNGEVLLVGQGTIGFGTSSTDPNAEGATFEYL